MTSILSKKDYKIIWVSSKNPEIVIVELNKNTLNGLISTKKRTIKKYEEISLKEYIKSWEINNAKNISWVYQNIDDLVSSLK